MRVGSLFSGVGGITDEGEEVELSDSPRYRMMGNAVTVSVAEWIGRRLGGVTQ